VERLWSIQECESEIDWWSRTLPSLRPRQQEAAPRKTENPLPSCHRAERGDLRDGGEWKRVPARGGKRIPSWPPSLAQLPLSNRYGALECEGPTNEDAGEDPSRVFPGMSQSAPCITTAWAKKKKEIIIIGDSLLRGTEGPICRPDPAHREVCCLPRTRVRDVARKLPGLVQPSGYYPLLVMRVGRDAIAERSPKAIKRDFRAHCWLMVNLSSTSTPRSLSAELLSSRSAPNLHTTKLFMEKSKYYTEDFCSNEFIRIEYFLCFIK